MREKPNADILNAMSKDPSNWKGVFYVNRKDPRLLVPKIIPTMGWTINLGHRYAYIGILLIAGILVLAFL